ncbi:MAG: ribosomal protein S18-alanine N-acetyltransferase [Lachnospiraceae bacterium]|nr:ribosomal protein S18-alanine N-acetyltransferase [Lachnospiraceae bacterium]
MEKKIDIIFATEAEIEAVWDLEKEIFSDSYSLKTLEDILSSKNEKLIIAKDEDNNTVGYIIYMAAADEGELLRVAVKKDARKNGIGEKLMNEMIDDLAKAEVKNIFLEVRISNEPAVGMYENMEFQTVAIRKKYYRNPTEDAMIMKRGL